MNSFSLTNSKRLIQSTHPPSEKQASLSYKIAECWLRQNNDEYQQLLIDAKELELHLLEEHVSSKNILKGFTKKKKPSEELQKELDVIMEENQQKKVYLNTYYQYLNDKLKSGTGSNNLFFKLESLSQNLTSKLEDEKTHLDEIVIKRKGEVVQYKEELSYIQYRKEALRATLDDLKETKESFKESEQKRKIEERERKEQQRDEYYRLDNNLHELLTEKEHLEKNENMLKKLLNVEDVHKKCWLSIERSIRSEFTSRLKEKYFKKALDMEYKEKLAELAEELKSKKADLEMVEESLETVKMRRETFKKAEDENNRKYKDAESQFSLQASQASRRSN